MTEEQNNLPEIPKSWVWTKIGEVINKISNGITKKQNKEGIGIPVTRIETISNAKIDMSRVGYLENLPAELVNKHRVLDGDILFSNINSDPHLGKTAIFHMKNITLLHGMNLLLIRANKEVIFPLFLDYLFNYYRYSGKFISIAHRAVNQSSINQTNLKKLKIPLAPFPEQQRIVARIEEFFARLDAGEESLKKVRTRLQQYRQAVLKHAFDGKLTGEWRRTHKHLIEPASALLERIREERNKKSKEQYREPPIIDILDLHKLPEGWVWARLGTCSDLITKGESPRWQGFDYVDEGIPFIRSQNVLWGKIDLSNSAKIPKEFHNKLKRSQIKPHDVLINLVGASIGRCGIVPSSLESANVNQAVALIRTNSALLPSYLMYILVSPSIQRYINSRKVETARPNISLTDLRQLLIPIAPLAEQRKIVEEIERRFSVDEQVKNIIEQSLMQSQKLRQSILKKAFEGRLVTQDPSDESAEKLLERIRKEKEKCGVNQTKVWNSRNSKQEQMELSSYVE